MRIYEERIFGSEKYDEEEQDFQATKRSGFGPDPETLNGRFAMFFLTDEYEYYRGDGDVGGRRVFADAIVAFGARYHFTERNALTLKAGWPFGFQVGVTF